VAQELVQKVQKNPAATEKLYVERLTLSQRNSFLILTRLSKAANTAENGSFGRSQSGDPTGLRDTDPLMLPIVVNGNIYLASLGHCTIGWRIYSDWSLTVDRLDGDKKVTAASFAFGMTSGRLIDVRVK
jgi:hypothetical protein